MKTFSPKVQFRKAHPDECASLREAIATRWFSESVSHALASLSFSATKEELKGARDFINTLLNLGEEEAAPNNPLPEKQLKTLDSPSSETPKET